MGSSEKVLSMIKQRSKEDFPNIEVETYSPPYKSEFNEEENNAIITAINKANPDLLWIGMTAPKQEKWIYTHWNELQIHCHCGTIGAVLILCRNGKTCSYVVAAELARVVLSAIERTT